MRGRRIRATAIAAAVACAAGTALTAPGARAAATPPLMGQWHLDAVAANFTPDSSGATGQDGSVPGAVSVLPGRFGTALEFDGASSSVRVAPAAGLAPERVTVLAWVRRDGTPGAYRYLVARGARACVGSSYALFSGATGGLMFYIYDGVGAGTVSPDAGTAVWDGQWHAVAGTFDGTAVRLYVDGRQVGEGTPRTAPIGYGTGDDSLVLGQYPLQNACEPSNFRYSGRLDEVRVYDRALTGTEIARLHDPAATAPPPLVADAPGSPPGPPGTPTTPITPTPSGPAAPALLMPPAIVDEPGARAGTSRCAPGTWTGTPTFTYNWIRVRGEQRSIVGTGETYRPPSGAYTAELLAGSRYVCEVQARNAGGVTTATTGAVLLVAPGLTEPLAAPYGNFRVRGIDVFQSTQPNSGATQYAWRPEGPFVALPGGGTPTGLRVDPIAVDLLGGTPQRATYAGVTLDATKSATAMVYVNMTDARAADRRQGLEVELTRLEDGAPAPARVAGGGVLRKVITSPEVSPLRVVNADERADPAYAVRFSLPPDWLLAAQRFGLRARVRFAPGQRLLRLRQCDRPGCDADDTYDLNGVPSRLLPSLSIAAIQMRRAGQAAFSPPSQLLRTARIMFPGGERMQLEGGYRASLDITGDTDVKLSDKVCEKKTEGTEAARLRDCKMDTVSTRLLRWAIDNPAASDASGTRYRSYDLLVGVHDYAYSGTDVEPGWNVGNVTNLPQAVGGDQPYLTINARIRPITAAAHELGHALGNPHPAGCDAGGAEPWAPDERGRLQSAMYDTRPRVGRGSPPAVRVDGAPDPVYRVRQVLYDLMSYCASFPSEVDSWISARNWNRSFGLLEDLAARMEALGTPRPPAGGTLLSMVPERGPVARRAATAPARAFAVGSAGPDGGRLARVVAGDERDAIPADVPGAPLRLRSLDASGRVLLDVGVAVARSSEAAAGGGGAFAGAVAPSAVAVELVRDGVALDRVERSRAPVVRLLAPGGAGVAGAPLGAVPVRWSAADPDGGGAPEATVDVSADGGRTWRTAFSGPSRGAVTLPAGTIERTARARVRVTVSDGFGEGTAVSRVFAARGTPPAVSLDRPAAGEALAGGRVVLLGGARDDAGRAIAGSRLTWFAGRRRLGTGARLRATLPAGRVTLRLEARDRAGRRASARRTVAVTGPPPRLTTLRAPRAVAPGARSLRLTVAASARGALRAGGRRVAVGPRRRTIVVALPARPSRGLLKVSFTLTADGRTARGVVEVVRP